jgi:hypothetical protein
MLGVRSWWRRAPAPRPTTSDGAAVVADARRVFALAVNADDTVPAGLADRLDGIARGLDGLAEPSRGEAALFLTAAAIEMPGRDDLVRRGFDALVAGGAGPIAADGTRLDRDLPALLAWIEAAVHLGERHPGFDLPGSVAGAAGRAAWFLIVRTAPDFQLPGVAEGRIRTAWERIAALGWAGNKPRLEALADDDWSMWTFAVGGVAVLHVAPKGKRARVVVDAGAVLGAGAFACPELSIGGVPVLIGSNVDGVRGPSRLLAARVDVSTGRASRKARVVVGTALDSPVAVTRTVAIQRSRMVVEDEVPAGPIRVRWAFADGVIPSLTDGATVTHRELGAIKLALDERLTWTVDGAAVVGTGTADADPLRFSVEWT